MQWAKSDGSADEWVMKQRSFGTVARMKSSRSFYGFEISIGIVNLIGETRFLEEMNKIIVARLIVAYLSVDLIWIVVAKSLRTRRSISEREERVSWGSVSALLLGHRRWVLTGSRKHNLLPQTLRVGATRASPDIYFVAKAHFSLWHVQGFKAIIFHLRLWHLWREWARASTHSTNQKCLSFNLLNARSQRQLEN